MSTIDPLPPPPDPGDSLSVFNSKAFAFYGAMPDLVTQINTVSGEVNTNATNAATSASTATTKAAESAATLLACVSSAQAAAASAGAPIWVSGATYAVGDPVWAPADNRVYRRKTAGAGTTDPSLDPTNWSAIAPNGLQLVLVSGTTGMANANCDTCFTNSALCAATVPTSFAVGDAFIVRFDNGRVDNTVDLGARSVKGPNGVILSGIITITTPAPFSLRWWGDYYRAN